ncbi:hypothetical protein SBRCBS47491_002148 [Sporothrix bragantina]|uniref:Uncharacterized protein n=1 Tax=Sporothrix bragantina TaxID=671064 RepID=A0ABP0B536_9PEZI
MTFETLPRVAANAGEDPYLALFLRLVAAQERSAAALEKQASQKPDPEMTWTAALVIGLLLALMIGQVVYIAKYHSSSPVTSSTPNPADPSPQPEEEGEEETTHDTGREQGGPRPTASSGTVTRSMSSSH